jgi:transcriptional regulator with XRE-family HTH domain
MAIRRRGPNLAFKAAREERGFTQRDVADGATKAATRLGYHLTFSDDQVSAIECLGRSPTLPRQRALCEFFELTPAELGFTVLTSEPARYDAESEVDPLDRRDALKGLGALLAVPLIDAAVQPLHRLASMSIPMAADGAEELVQHLGYGYSGEPPSRLLPRLRELTAFADVMADIAPGPYGMRFRSIAGWSSGLLANAMHDVGDPGAAGATILLALAYGQQVGDARLVAYVRDRQAMMAGDRDDYDAMLRFAEAGLAEAPPITAIRFRLLGARARAMAGLRRRAEALVALRAADAEFELLPTSALNESSFAVNPGAGDSTAGPILFLLGDYDDAHASTERAMIYHGSLPGHLARPSRFANKQLDLAYIYLRQGDADEGARLATAALSSKRLIDGLRRKLGKFGSELITQHPTLPAAQQFAEQYQALLA